MNHQSSTIGGGTPKKNTSPASTPLNIGGRINLSKGTDYLKGGWQLSHKTTPTMHVPKEPTLGVVYHTSIR